jgi:NADPH:quinone reductase-like Zn-dependent oxidoreductase
MRAVVIPKPGPPDVLTVDERPDPPVSAGEVRIAVRAAGINFADTMARAGTYPDAPPTPSVVGYEVAGEVESVGEGVEAKVGDRVLAGTRFGGYAELAVTDAANAIPLPEGWSFEEGAALPVNYATAYAGLVRYGSLAEGERALIHAAAGGVGIAATQIAKLRGAEVFGTASAAKHDAIRAQGADEVHGHDVSKLGKVDVVLDAIGGASHKRSYKLLRPGGRLIAFGASSVVSGEKRNLLKAAPQALRMVRGFNLMEMMSSSRSVIGLNMLRLWDDRGTLEPWITPLQEWLQEGTLQPVVAAEVPFDKAPEAHRMLGERRNVGKVVLVP